MVSCWLIDAYTQRTNKIAPSAQVASYNATGGAGGVPRITITQNYFVPSGDPFFASDVAAFAETFASGHKVVLMSSEYVRLSIPLTIVGLGNYWIDISAAPTTAPVAGNIIETENYDNASSTQQEAYAFAADTNGKLGTTNTEDANVRM
jgi:hypothetical protein